MFEMDLGSRTGRRPYDKRNVGLRRAKDHVGARSAFIALDRLDELAGVGGGWWRHEVRSVAVHAGSAIGSLSHRRPKGSLSCCLSVTVQCAC
jgi:hypothetical protein